MILDDNIRGTKKLTDQIIQEVVDYVKQKDPKEPEFIQAVEEFMNSQYLIISRNMEYANLKIYKRIVEPDRVLMFRVPWMDDSGEIQVNRGFRVQFSNVLGPYKGGLRFHASVNLSIIKFLAFEQIFRNSLTTLPFGGAYGGSDFSIRGKSDAEIMRFCQSFIREMYRHIKTTTDILDTGIGLTEREMSYLFGYYKSIINEYSGGFTGKSEGYQENPLKPLAAGYGVIYFLGEMLAIQRKQITNQRIAISGSGKIALSMMDKALDLGAKVVTISDSDGTVIIEQGVDQSMLEYIKQLKFVKRARIKELADHYQLPYYPGLYVWDVLQEQGIKVDIALPGATQNEIDGQNAQYLIDSGCNCVVEGSNMACNHDAINLFLEQNILYGPSKAANIGGIALSGLEIAYSNLKTYWSQEEINQRLYQTMKKIHRSCYEAADAYGKTGNYLAGANIASFQNLAKALVLQGIQ